jgi:hypothetical protein
MVIMQVLRNNLLMGVVFILGLLLLVSLSPMTAHAATKDATTACQGIAATGAGCGSGEAGVETLIQTVIKILMYVVGVASVIMLVIGGLRYVTSGGDNSAVASAKNTIIYSVIGLIVAIIAVAIVNKVTEGF